jgi:hypothetical protein
MGKTSYLTVNGMIIGESTGGVNRAFGLDALGSVVVTYTGSSVENTYQYKPYGGLLAKTGIAPDPYFLWNGGSGYRATSLFAVTHYVLARHFSSSSAAWTTLDPKWPQERAYAYANSRPVVDVDRTGMGSPCPDKGAIAGTSTTCPLSCKGACIVGTCPSDLSVCPLRKVISTADASAITYCNFDTYTIYTWSCDNCSAIETIIDCHENQHRMDMSDCCGQVGACVKHYGEAKKEACKNAFRYWVQVNSAVLECRAYAKSYSSAKAWAEQMDCLNKKNDTCCTIVEGNIPNYSRRMNACGTNPKLTTCNLIADVGTGGA